MNYRLYRIDYRERLQNHNGHCSFLAMDSGITMDVKKYKEGIESKKNILCEVVECGIIRDGELGFLKNVLPKWMLEIKE